MNATLPPPTSQEALYVSDTSSTKTYPRCGATLFSDMDVCYRCFHRFAPPTFADDYWSPLDDLCDDALWDSLEGKRPLLELPYLQEDLFPAEKLFTGYPAFSPMWEDEMQGSGSLPGSEKFYDPQEWEMPWAADSYLTGPYSSDGFTGVDFNWGDALLPHEYGGNQPFLREDSQVDEMDNTCDLTAIHQSLSYGLHLVWRGVEVTIPVSAQGLTIGCASSCDVVLHSGAISRKHLQVVVEDGMVLVADLGSVNQALLDGKPVEVCEPWLLGSVLDLCGARFSLILLDPRE